MTPPADSSAIADPQPKTSSDSNVVKFSDIIPLQPWQRNLVNDPARQRGLLKSRQIGGSFVGAFIVAMDAAENGEDWNMMSRSQRQAEKLLIKVAMHIKAFDIWITSQGLPSIIKPNGIGLRRIELVNGATIEAVPCDPDTTAGDCVNWFVDEFALFPKSEDVFAVIKPSIMRGKKIVIASSPRGRNHKFCELYNNFLQYGADSGWSWHRVTIEDAINEGLVLHDHKGNPVSYDEFRKQELRDMTPEMYSREYMCQFSDSLTSFLSWATITRCQVERLPMRRTLEQLHALGRPLYVGLDIGIRHDLTVVWILSRTGDVHVTESIFTMQHTAPKAQEEFMRALLKLPSIRRCCIDETGVGMHLASNLKGDFGDIVDPVYFTNRNKAEMANGLSVSMENGEFFMPSDDDLREDFASIEKSISGAGNIQIAAPRSDIGHGDRFWAACLATRAAVSGESFELVMSA